MEGISSLMLPFQLSNSLIKHMPPLEAHSTLEKLTTLTKDSKIQELLDYTYAPLQTSVDSEKGEEFIRNPYYSYKKSYRSPLTNTYYPPSEEAYKFPPSKYLSLEKELNTIYRQFTSHYIPSHSAICSVHLIPNKGNSFDAHFLTKHKKKDSSSKGSLKHEESGQWEVIHVFTVSKNASKSTFQLSTTLYFTMGNKKEESKSEAKSESESKATLRKLKEERKEDKIERECCMMELSCALKYELTEHHVCERESNRFYIENMGNMLEKVENRLRREIFHIYFNKMQTVYQSLRSTSGPSVQKLNLLKELQLNFNQNQQTPATQNK